MYQFNRPWSYSSLEQYVNGCSLAFFYRYLDPEACEESVSSALLFGSALHDAHAHVYESLRDNGEVDQEGAVKAFAESWELFASNPLIQYKKQEDVMGLLEHGVLMLKTFFASMKKEKVLDVDSPFTVLVDLPDGNEVELTGIMDLVVEGDNGTTIVDFKTAGSRWSQSKADDALQASIYCLAAQTLYPGVDVNFRYDVVTKAKTPIVQSIGTKRLGRDFERVRALIQAARAGVDAGIFHPSESFRCFGCEFANRCKAWRFQEATALAV